MAKRIDPMFAGSFAMQPSGHRAGSTIAYTAGIYEIADQAGNTTIAKGLTVAADGSGGDLVVHLVDDFDANDDPVYCTLPLSAGERVGFLFDAILEAGTTIALAELTIWL